MGGKHMIGRVVSEFLVKTCPPDNCPGGYLEPFCGSLGVFKHMTDKGYSKYIASDKHPDLVEMWKQIQANTLRLPKNISEREYNRLKDAPSPDAMKAVAGFALSFGGKYFAGFANKWSGPRDFMREFATSIAKIAPTIQRPGVTIVHKSYDSYTPHGMLIYCDPPYRNTESYSGVESFDSDRFWEIMRVWSRDNCVLVSEESAPSDFRVVWSKKKMRGLNNKNQSMVARENIYMYRGNTPKPTKKYTKRANKTNKANKTYRIKHQ